MGAVGARLLRPERREAQLDFVQQLEPTTETLGAFGAWGLLVLGERVFAAHVWRTATGRGRVD